MQRFPLSLFTQKKIYLEHSTQIKSKRKDLRKNESFYARISDAKDNV